MVDDFIGELFGKDKQIRVIGRSAIRNNGRLKYDILCSACAKDPELYGDGVFQMSKAHLREGKLTCGCSSPKYYSGWQQKIRIRRACESRNTTLIDFAEEFKGGRTKLHLKCNIDGYEWKSCHIQNYLSGKGCPQCKKESLRSQKTYTDEEVNTLIAVSKRFSEGSKFSRIEKARWLHYCPICEVDEYAINGVGTGYFETTLGALIEGNVNCRCGERVRLNKDQRNYVINRDISGNEKLTFYGWDNTEYFILDCKEHGQQRMKFMHYKNVGVRCPTCNRSGYSQDKTGYLYVLKISGIHTDFIGFGVSNVLESRVVKHKRNLKDFGLSITEETYYTGSGRDILDLEFNMKKSLNIFPQEMESFKREAVRTKDERLLFEFIENYIDGTDIYRYNK